MSIFDTVTKLKTEYEEINGLVPKYLYLGNKEANELALWAVEMGYLYEDELYYILAGRWIGNRRPEFLQMQVLVVNVESHLRVSH